jgi:hypothetical protein
MKNVPPPAYHPADGLPPWKCRDQRDADKLIKWTIFKLDQEQALCERYITVGEYMRRNPSVTQDDVDAAFDRVERQMNPTYAYAMEVYVETGDKSLLEIVNPKIAKKLPQIKPSGKRGGGRPCVEKHGDSPSARIWSAVWEVKTIKLIWREHFGHYYRPGNDKVRARDIAAKRHGIKAGSRAEVTFDQRLRKGKG